MITRETGGEIINVEQTAAFDAAFGTVISHLRKRYLPAYYPSGAERGGVFHEIKVQLSARYGKPGSDYFVNAKRGYYDTARSAVSSAASNFQHWLSSEICSKFVPKREREQFSDKLL